MKIRIKETNEIKELKITDKNGVNWVDDFIDANDRQSWTKDKDDNYLLDQDQAEYWEEMTSIYQQYYDLKNELAELHGRDKIEDLLVNEVCDAEFNDYAYKAIEVLNNYKKGN